MYKVHFKQHHPAVENIIISTEAKLGSSAQRKFKNVLVIQ